jgi:thioredoxin reductase (NADPH)
MEKKELIIIGGGAAGLTAAIYASRANLSPLLFEGFQSGPVGGQLTTTTEVENFPGFPEGVLGGELMEKMRLQALKFGTNILTEDIEEISLGASPFLVRSTQRSFYTKALILATGASVKKLDIPGSREGEFWQKGVTACAICDGASPLFRGKDLYVVGGGDTAIEEALFLTKYAKSVFIVHRRNTLRASKIMQERVLRHPKVKILWNREMVEILGEKVVKEVVLKDVQTQALERKEAGGVFFAIGFLPNTGFLKNQLALDPLGYILVTKGSCKTSKEGVFAAGDVQDPSYRQAVVAAASGCMAAIEAERFLSEKEG